MVSFQVIRICPFRLIRTIEIFLSVMYTVSRKRKGEVLVGCPFAKRKDVGIQCSESRGRYGRNEESKILTYDQLKEKYLWSKDHTLHWLKDEGLIKSRRVYDVCQSSTTSVAEGGTSKLDIRALKCLNPNFFLRIPIYTL